MIPYTMNPYYGRVDLERQDSQTTPGDRAFFFLIAFLLDKLMIREEEVGGSETREKAAPRPHGGGSNDTPQRSEGPNQAQTRTRVYFSTIVENSMT